MSTIEKLHRISIVKNEKKEVIIEKKKGGCFVDNIWVGCYNSFIIKSVYIVVFTTDIPVHIVVFCY